MLFNFTLVPVDEVQPWGYPGSLSLSWFALTDGQYWIETGKSTLFEYSEQAQAAGAPRYCSYQVVRLYEDLMKMLPYILEPVPSQLVQYITGDSGIAWYEAYATWCDLNDGHYAPDRFWEIIDASTAWMENRTLDSAYLSPSANIVIWSDSANVYFEWDNRTRVFNDLPAWSALRGKYQLARDECMAEIQSFHLRLMEQMSKRVEWALSGAFPAEINIDLPSLAREHEQRCRTLEMALSSSALTDWQKAERSINEILSA